MMLLLVQPIAARGGSVQQEAERILLDQHFRHASVGLSIVDIDNGKVLAAVNSQQSLIPASTLKLVVTAAALERVGADYRFSTTLYHSGEVDEWGTLKGNVYIAGSGDPSLGSEHIEVKRDSFLTLFIHKLVDKGIKRIEGGVISIAPAFSHPDPISGKWLWEDVANGYGCGLYGINLFDNTFSVRIKTASDMERQPLLTDPSMENLYIHNQLQAWDKQTDSILFYPSPLDGALILAGRVSESIKERTVKGAIPNPPLLMATLIDDRLNALGISTEQSPSVIQNDEEIRVVEKIKRTEVASYSSPTLLELARLINFKSINHYSNALLNVFAQTESNSELTAPQLLQRYWQERGIEVSGTWIHDGSGLAPTNRLTAKFLTDVITDVVKSGPNASLFLSTLPIAGKEGTVVNLMKNGKGTHFRLKSGSMSGVIAYTGIAEHGGRRYALAIVVNNYLGTRVGVLKKIEEILFNVQ